MITLLTRATLLLTLLPALAIGEESRRTLRVGPGERFTQPSQAAAAARGGDTVLIAAGRYTNCAVWRAAGLTIAAAGGAVELSGPVCGDKALFVTTAPGITVIGITFRGAVSTSGNGAGIRAEGGDLTIRRSRFEDNENGILAADHAAATLLVEDSAFIGNGALRPGQACAHGIYAGRLGQLVIRRSRFEATHICHHVKSRAARTEVADSIIADTQAGDSSYLVDVPNGGDLLLRGNMLSKGPHSQNPTTAIAIGFEGVSQPTTSLRITGNHFENLLPLSTVFVHNRSTVPAELAGNTLVGRVAPLVGPGRVMPGG